MHIGFEVSNVTIDHATGVASSIIALISALAGQIEGHDHLTLFYKLSRWRRRRSWWRPAGLPVRLYHGRWWPPVTGVDIVHGLDCVVPPWTRVKRLVTFNDLLMMFSDDTQIAPEGFRRKKRQLYKAAAARADVIITISARTKQDVVQLLKVPETRVYVTHLGIDQHFGQQTPEAIGKVLKHYALVPGYLLFTGAISGRKNTARLVQAYARSHASKERRLVLVGAMSYRSEDTLEAVHQCGLNKRVQLLGYVPDEDLPALYAGAGCFVFPTLYEGFGMPILEAMASGTPVLTSTTGAAPEISGGLAVCVNPYDVEAIADGIDHALETPTSTLAQAREHAKTFTWERCASQTLAIYRHIACTTHSHHKKLSYVPPTG
jgi:glycosyltransferase involved in cell wall biosynthesis